MLTASCYSSQYCFTFFCSFSWRLTESVCSTNALPIAMHRQTRSLLYSCLRTLKYRTLAHLSFTNTIQTLRILKPLSHPAPDTAAATRPCSQITLGRLVFYVIRTNMYRPLLKRINNIRWLQLLYFEVGFITKVCLWNMWYFTNQAFSPYYKTGRCRPIYVLFIYLFIYYTRNRCTVG